MSWSESRVAGARLLPPQPLAKAWFFVLEAVAQISLSMVKSCHRLPDCPFDSYAVKLCSCSSCLLWGVKSIPAAACLLLTLRTGAALGREEAQCMQRINPGASNVRNNNSQVHAIAQQNKNTYIEKENMSALKLYWTAGSPSPAELAAPTPSSCCWQGIRYHKLVKKK